MSGSKLIQVKTATEANFQKCRDGSYDINSHVRPARMCGYDVQKQ